MWTKQFDLEEYSCEVGWFSTIYATFGLLLRKCMAECEDLCVQQKSLREPLQHPKARRARSERLYIKSTLFCDQEELVSSGGWNIGAIIKRRLAEIAVFSLWWIFDSFVTYKCRLRRACMAAMLLRISGHAIIKGSFVNTLSVYYL